MSRFLFTAWPFSGHIHPCLRVAAALRERGHSVAFYTGAAYRSQIEQQGFECFPFANVATRLRRYLNLPHGGDTPDIYARLSERYTAVGISNPFKRSKTKGLMFREMIAGTLAEQAADLESIHARWRPGAIVTDAMFWGPMVISHERLRVPVAVLCFFAGCMLPGAGLAPFGLGLPRARSWPRRIFNNTVSTVAQIMSAGVRKRVNTLRRQHGLGPMDCSVAEFSGRMPLYLVTSTTEFDGERPDLPPSVRYIGPCLWDGPAAEPVPDWLASLTSDRPLIYVSEGTAQVRKPILLPAAIQGLTSAAVQVVLTTGHHRDPRDLGTLPANMRVERFIPHSVLFPRTSVVVTNGGSSSVRDALRLGVPLVVAPMEWDQLENAQRVVESGAGVRIDAGKCSPTALRRAVDTVLRNGAYRQNAARIADSFARAGQADRAAELLEHLAPATRHAQV